MESVVDEWLRDNLVHDCCDTRGVNQNPVLKSFLEEPKIVEKGQNVTK